MLVCAGLWRIRRWRPVHDLVPEFLCSLQGLGEMVADVAIRPNGGTSSTAAAVDLAMLWSKIH